MVFFSLPPIPREVMTFFFFFFFLLVSFFRRKMRTFFLGDDFCWGGGGGGSTQNLSAPYENPRPPSAPLLKKILATPLDITYIIFMKVSFRTIRL